MESNPVMDSSPLADLNPLLEPIPKVAFEYVQGIETEIMTLFRCTNFIEIILPLTHVHA